MEVQELRSLASNDTIESHWSIERRHFQFPRSRYSLTLDIPLSTVFLQPVELVTTCTLTMLGALVRAAYCAL